MKEPKRYSCGNGEGMFEDDKNGYWVEYSEYKAIVDTLNKQLRQLPVGRSRRYWMIISRVEPLTKDAQLPIYWLKRIAERDAETFGGTVVPVKITW